MAITVPSLRADRFEWVELLGTAPSDSTLEGVGISRQLWRAILADKSPAVPIACLRLARYQRYTQLSDLAGPCWHGFEVRGSSLLFPGIKYPLSAEALRSTWLHLQELPALRHNLEQARRELAVAEANARRAEELAYYWRRMCSLEARAGMMLSSLMTV